MGDEEGVSEARGGGGAFFLLRLVVIRSEQRILALLRSGSSPHTLCRRNGGRSSGGGGSSSRPLRRRLRCRRLRRRFRRRLLHRRRLRGLLLRRRRRRHNLLRRGRRRFARPRSGRRSRPDIILLHAVGSLLILLPFLVVRRRPRLTPDVQLPLDLARRDLPLLLQQPLRGLREAPEQRCHLTPQVLLQLLLRPLRRRRRLVLDGLLRSRLRALLAQRLQEVAHAARHLRVRLAVGGAAQAPEQVAGPADAALRRHRRRGVGARRRRRRRRGCRCLVGSSRRAAPRLLLQGNRRPRTLLHHSSYDASGCHLLILFLFGGVASPLSQ
eukprot:Rhum_TRINITY_DN13557_c0_g1::Rhum_TRINITY_DN13557_c0_g1_i1::g.61156::m.61156